jgi:predicted amidohydrolase YtcJ
MRTLVRNAVLYPHGTAMLVDGDRLAWVGDDAEADRYDADQVVDVGGRLVTPAFVDAHVHLSQTGVGLRSVDLSAAAGAGEVLDAVAERARTQDVGVLLGFNWDETTWADRTLPTAAELDRAAPGRHVYLSRVDGHSGLVSAALADHVSGIADAPGWDGTGRVERDAHHLVRDAISALTTKGQVKRALVAALADAVEAGLGCVHELAAPHLNAPGDFALIREIGEEVPILDVVPYWGEHVEAGGVERARELGCRGAAGDLNIDGAFGSRTAALRADYADRPGHRGHRYLDPEQVAAHVVACARAGLQAGYHCIGDAGTASAVDGFRLAVKEIGVDAIRAGRHRLEHVELIDLSSLAELAEWGVVVSAQPAFDAAWGGTKKMYAERLGADRALVSNPLASFHAAGITLAFGSDSPVTPLDPWGGVRAAVQHHNENERLPVDVAFAAHTVGGWRAAGIDDAGELRQGQLASYAVWDTATFPDLAGGEPGPRCLRTAVRGRIVFDEEGALG